MGNGSRFRNKGEAAFAVAIGVAASQVDLAGLEDLGKRLKDAPVSAAGLSAVYEALRPFIKITGSPNDQEGTGGDGANNAGDKSVPPVTPSDSKAPHHLSTGSRSPRPVAADLKMWARQQIERETGRPVTRVGRGETYQSGSGHVFHLRSMHPYDRGANRYSYWFGLNEEKWADPSARFVLVCGTDGILVIPVSEWLPYKPLIARAKDDTEIQPSVWLNDGRFELRAQGEHIDASRWLDRFDLL